MLSSNFDVADNDAMPSTRFFNKKHFTLIRLRDFEEFRSKSFFRVSQFGKNGRKWLKIAEEPAQKAENVS